MRPPRILGRSLICLLVVGASDTNLAQSQDAARQPDFAFGTTVQQPTFGVMVDAQGVLTAARVAEPGDPRLSQNVLVAQQTLAPNVCAPSRLRKISLTRLLQALATRADAGQGPTETMAKLAGLLQLRFLCIAPDRQEIILAGPAEGWAEDAAGRVLGIRSHAPTILLEDLLVALQAYPVGGRPPAVGCSIEPTRSAMSRLSEFNRAIPSAVPQQHKPDVALRVVLGTREALGLADVFVFTISPRTHMAQVMVEADYRMKCMALGLEPPPIAMPTFWGQLTQPPRTQMQRWWFKPDVRRVKLSADRQCVEWVDAGVILSTEDYEVLPSGAVRPTGRAPAGAAQAFASAFTEHYPRIAAASPVFQQLRNMVDLLVAAAFLQQADSSEEWQQECEVTLVEWEEFVTRRRAPKQAPCLVNADWRGQHLIAASGGVVIHAHHSLQPENLLVFDEEELQLAREQVLGSDRPQEQWWWD